MATEMNIIKDEPKELRIEFQSGDLTVPDLIANELLKNDDVEFAGVTKDHPEVGKPVLVLKTGKKKAADVLSKTLEDLTEKFTKLEGELSKKK
ncbi:MAG: hypothetical protein KGH98_01385 [Candidatus Micrarchaeota archaeon]|nr:hypothetical protein [Candidatus Micrarchaeota archaeon]